MPTILEYVGNLFSYEVFMLVFLIYLADFSDRVSNITQIVAIFSGIGWVAGRFFTTIALEENTRQPVIQELQNLSKIAGILCISCTITFGITPKKETVWMMTAAHVGYQIVDTPEIQKVRTLVNQKLETLIKESIENNKGE